MLGETFDPSTDSKIVQTAPDSIYTSSLEEVAPGITGIVASTQNPGESWTDALVKVLPAIAATVQQKQLLQVQVDRAKAGLPPLDVSQYTPGVNVGLSKDTQQLLIYGGIAAIVAVLLVSYMHKR
jgi:hypothetical protein